MSGKRKSSFLFLVILCFLCLGCGGGGGSDSNGGGTTNPPPSNVPTLPAGPTSDPTSWWNGSVFYELFVRSYADASSGGTANDGIGDFRGLIERLDYLNDGDPNTTTDLGINAIWLMPMMQSPSYHGYDVTDYFQVEQDYGDNADFQAFMSEAHNRGIRVILDLVLNHASAQHSRFLSAKNPTSPYRDWFIWSDTHPGYEGPWGQPVWHRSGSAYFYGLFWSGMPDWNFRKNEVTAYMNEVTRFWLEEMDVDGYRLDAIRYLLETEGTLEDTEETHQWLENYVAHYKGIKSDALTVGEVWASSEIVASYKGEMDMNFQFDLAAAIVDAARNGNGSRLEAEANRAWQNFEPGQFATFITNHDQNRVMSELSGDVTRAKLAATILLTLPGVPFIYYGEEIGMQGVKPDELIRRPLQWSAQPGAGFSAVTPWQAPDGNYPSVNIAQQTADENSLFHLYRHLIQTRLAHPALKLGNYVPVATSSNNLIAFLRSSSEQSALVLLNVGAAALSEYSVSLDADYDGAGELVHNANPSKGSLVEVNGVPGYQPIATLQGRSGYVILLP